VVCRCNRIMFYVNMTILEPEVSSFRNADATFTQHTDCTLRTYEGTRNRVNVTAAIIDASLMVNVHMYLSCVPSKQREPGRNAVHHIEKQQNELHIRTHIHTYIHTHTHTHISKIQQFCHITAGYETSQCQTTHSTSTK
jgi:hypothetical protein